MENEFFTVNPKDVELMVNEHKMNEQLSIIALCSTKGDVDRALTLINDGKVKIRKGNAKTNKTPIKGGSGQSKIVKKERSSSNQNNDIKQNNNNGISEDNGLTSKGLPRKRKRNMCEAKLYKCNDCGQEFKARRLSKPAHTFTIFHQCKSYNNKQIKRVPSHVYPKDKCNGNHDGPCVISLESNNDSTQSNSLKQEPSNNMDSNIEPPKKKQKLIESDSDDDLMVYNYILFI